MANFFKYGRNRRDNKPAAEVNTAWYRSMLFYRAVLAGMFIFVTLLLFPHPETYQFPEYKEGSISDEEIIAPFTFFVQKSPDELEKQQQQAKNNVLPVYLVVDSVLISALDELNAFRDRLNSILLERLPDSTKYPQIEDLMKQHKILLGEEYIPFFGRLIKPGGRRTQQSESLRVYFEQLKKILTEIYLTGILNTDKTFFSRQPSKILLVSGSKEEERALDAVFELDVAKEQLLTKLRSQFGQAGDYVKVGFALLDDQVKANLFFNERETSRRIAEAIANVPTVKYRILKGERIIDSHQRISSEHVEILHSLALELVKQERQAGIFTRILVWLGKLFLIVLSLVPLVIFLFYQRPRIWHDRRMLFIIAVTMLFVVIISTLVLNYKIPKFLIPIAIVPIVVTSYLDTRTGIFAGLSLSFLIGAQNGNDFELVLVGMLVSAATILALGFARYHNRLAKSMVFILVAYFVGITVLGIVRYIRFHDLLIFWGSGFIVSILSPMIAYSFVILFDAIFDVASEFKLIQLGDLNNPILKMISMYAPGTYHHSLQVSNLSEAAAEAIGANALLTRVGAYYHDIGKMFMPEYFVENQIDGKNPHDRLTPRLSSLILINHVRKGYEFARKNKIPTVVSRFITEHHGSSLMKFFYDKAVEKAKGEDILETDFRYPGTKPQSKETGILMLADAVEATVRSIKEPNLGKIRNAIRNVIEDKIQSGEFDNCPLTMKDLGVIVDTFSHMLLGIYHGRLEYPGQSELLKRPITELLKGKDNL